MWFSISSRGELIVCFTGRARQKRRSTISRDLVNPKQIEAAVAGRLGPEEINADWTDPRPWTEKYDVILWLVLGIAVILLGFSSIALAAALDGKRSGWPDTLHVIALADLKLARYPTSASSSAMLTSFHAAIRPHPCRLPQPEAHHQRFRPVVRAVSLPQTR